MTTTLTSGQNTPPWKLRLRAVLEGAMSVHYLAMDASPAKQAANQARLETAVQARMGATGQDPVEAEQSELSDQFTGVALVVAVCLVIGGAGAWSSLTRF